MKLKSYIIAALTLLTMGSNAWAQRDITSTYITNATLSNGTTGWTVNNFNTPVQGNNTIGYASECYAGWGSLEKTAYSLTQTITLNAGHYRLVNYSFFRQGQAYNTDNTKSLAYLKAGSDQVAIKTLGSITAAGYANSQAEGANCFDSKMYRNVVEFTIAADATSIEIGIVGTFDEMRSWCIVGMFELFDLDDLASVSSPTDVTYEITNSGFEHRDMTGWTLSPGDAFAAQANTAFDNKAGGYYAEKWQGSGGLSDRTMSQHLTGLENGLYELKAYVYYGGTGAYIKMNDDRTNVTAGTSAQYTVRTVISDGTLDVVAGLESGTTNWVCFDRFTLSFYGDPLQAFKDLLADKVAEAQALHDGGTLRTGAATQLQTAIDANDNDDDAFTTEGEFDTAIANIDAAMLVANSIAARYAVFDAEKTKWEALKAGVPSCASLTTFESAISTANTAVTNATSVAAVNTQIAALRPAAMTFISTTDDHTFDLTFLASQTYSDWKKKDGSAAGIVADQFLTGRPGSIPSFAESYETTCATTGTVLYQTIEDLPAGYYEVGMYAQAMYTPNRGFETEATEGDANRTYAFAGDLDDATSVLRVGMPISFQSSVAFEDITTLAVNVHLTGDDLSNNLTYGVQKDENGSNWHFAQIMTITYATQPDLTALEAQRDEKVAIAEGFLATHLFYLNNDQSDALQDAIDEAKAADDFEELSAVIVSLPTAVDAARIVANGQKAGRESLLNALQRFEDNYNHYTINDVFYGDGTDYSRLTMSAGAWTTLLTLVNNAALALDDRDSNASYATLATILNSQLNATDTSIRLFKSYKAMVAGCQALSIAEGTTYAASSNMDTDATENTAIEALNTAFISYREAQSVDIDMSGFLGANLDFSETQGSLLVTGTLVYDLVGWEETYSNVQANERIQTNADGHSEELYLRSNWTDKNPVLEVAKLKMLPEGDYQLSLSWNSPMTNMINHSAYVLGGTSNAIGEATSGATTLTYDFTVSGSATNFDFILGFQKQNSGNSGAEIVADNITLTCKAGTPFHIAYTEAAAAYDDTDATTMANTAAAKAAIDQYAAYTSDESGLLEAGVRGDNYNQAVNVLRNAKTIAENNGDATTLIANYDLSNTTLSDGKAPNGWTTAPFWTANDGNGNTNDVFTQNGQQVYNVWYRNGITDIEINQTINNLPNGTYRFSVDLGTNGFTAPDAASMVAFIRGDRVGASEQISTWNNDAGTRVFGTYSAATEITSGNQVTIGIRSVGHYFQMTSPHLEYIGNDATAAQETDASYLRQDYFWRRYTVTGDNGAHTKTENQIYEYDATNADFANAKNVVIYGNQANMIVKAAAVDQFENTNNKVVNGVCANLVITDGSPLSITSTTGEFEATTATYSRAMSNVWGTLILPFPVQAVSGQAFYTLRSVDEGEGTMGFNRIGDEIPANTPLAFRMTAGGDQLDIEMSNVDVELTTATQNDATTVVGWKAEGTYSSGTTLEHGNNYYYIAQNKFWNASVNDVRVAPFRAWYHYTGESSVKSFSIAFNDDWTDGIEPLNMDNGQGVMNETDIYDLQGRRVARPTKGIYVVGGRKVVIK